MRQYFLNRNYSYYHMQFTGTSRAELRERIVTAGLKATLQRIIIYETLFVLHDTHPSADELFQNLKAAHPGISLGTVYKTLDSFAEVNLVKRVLSDDKRRFDVNEQPHNHIYCTNTNEIIDYSDPELEKLVTAYFKGKNFGNFNIQTISLQITGSKTDPKQKISIT